MGYLKDEDFEDLPDDDGDAFVYLESIARDKLFQSRGDGDDLSYEEFMSFMNEITAIASYYNIPDIYIDSSISNIDICFSDFIRKVEFRAVQIRAQRAQRNRKNSVSIDGAARERIQHYLERLKEEVRASNLHEDRRKVLLDKIADFEAELVKKRINFAAAMAVVALFAAASNDFVEAGEKVLSLTHSIAQVLGGAKEREEGQRNLLPPREPFKAIPDMRPQPDQSENWHLSDADDDLPV